MPGPAARPALPTPFGRVSLLWLVMLRVYDEWVHMEDVRRALSLADDDGIDALPVAAKFLLCSTQKLFGDSASLPLRQYGHATKMPFFRGDDLTADCAHDGSGVCDRHKNGHAMEPFMNGIRPQHGVFESLWRVALAIRLERCLQTVKNSIRIPGGSSPDCDARSVTC